MTENPFLAQAAQTAPAAAQPVAQQAPAAVQGNPFGAAPAAAQPVAQQAPASAQGFSAPPSGADPFATPAGPGDGANITDDLGAAVVVRPSEYVEKMTTSFGEASAVRADWIVLDGPNQGQVREGSLIFQRALIRDLKSVLGSPGHRFVVGRLAKGEAKQGQSAPYILQSPDEATMALARQAAAAFQWV